MEQKRGETVEILTDFVASLDASSAKNAKKRLGAYALFLTGVSTATSWYYPLLGGVAFSASCAGCYLFLQRALARKSSLTAGAKILDSHFSLKERAVSFTEAADSETKNFIGTQVKDLLQNEEILRGVPQKKLKKRELVAALFGVIGWGFFIYMLCGAFFHTPSTKEAELIHQIEELLKQEASLPKPVQRSLEKVKDALSEQGLGSSALSESLSSLSQSLKSSPSKTENPSSPDQSATEPMRPLDTPTPTPTSTPSPTNQKEEKKESQAKEEESSSAKGGSSSKGESKDESKSKEKKDGKAKGKGQQGGEGDKGESKEKGASGSSPSGEDKGKEKSTQKVQNLAQKIEAAQKEEKEDSNGSEKKPGAEKGDKEGGADSDKGSSSEGEKKDGAPEKEPGKSSGKDAEKPGEKAGEKAGQNPSETPQDKPSEKKGEKDSPSPQKPTAQDEKKQKDQTPGGTSGQAAGTSPHEGQEGQGLSGPKGFKDSVIGKADEKLDTRYTEATGETIETTGEGTVRQKRESVSIEKVDPLVQKEVQRIPLEYKDIIESGR